MSYNLEAGIKRKAINPRSEQKIVAISTLVLGALAWMGRRLS